MEEGNEVIVKRLSETRAVIGNKKCVKDITLEDVQKMDLTHHVLYQNDNDNLDIESDNMISVPKTVPTKK